jgi:hypothetical protein
MPPSNSPLSFRNIRAAGDRAIANGRGINITCAGLGEAHSMRFSFYQMRMLDRKENLKIYPQDHALHGRSIYDCLTAYPAQKDDGTIVLTILVSNAEALNERIEEL